MRRRISTLALFLVPLALAACGDSVTGGRPAAEVPGKRSILAKLNCTVDVPTLTTTCTPEAAGGAGGGPSFGIYGQNQVKMRSYNVRWDASTFIYQADITVENLLAGLMGTPDGATITGIKIFHNTGPTATKYYVEGDTGTVYVFNPDGYDYFTAPDQPYFYYDEILAQNDTSQAKLWQWFLPSTVEWFSFTVLVSADLYTGMAAAPAIIPAAPLASAGPRPSRSAPAGRRPAADGDGEGAAPLALWKRRAFG